MNIFSIGSGRVCCLLAAAVFLSACTTASTTGADGSAAFQQKTMTHPRCCHRAGQNGNH